jgi:exonuclease VII large subunit
MTTFTTPSDPIIALEGVLSEQLEAYETYASYVRQDEENMAKLRLDQLEQNNKLKATILLKIQTMDRARQNLVRQISKKYQLQEEKVQIADICRAVGGQMSLRLSELRERLHRVMMNLKDLQSRTQLFADASLSWINGSVNALKGLLSPAGIYTPQGRLEKPGMFVGKRVEKQA